MRVHIFVVIAFILLSFQNCQQNDSGSVDSKSERPTFKLENGGNGSLYDGKATFVHLTDSVCPDGNPVNSRIIKEDEAFFINRWDCVNQEIEPVNPQAIMYLSSTTIGFMGRVFQDTLTVDFSHYASMYDLLQSAMVNTADPVFGLSAPLKVDGMHMQCALLFSTGEIIDDWQSCDGSIGYTGLGSGNFRFVVRILNVENVEQKRDVYDWSNGGWSQFSNWGACSKSCGGGVSLRSRSCTSPLPSNGGMGCQGVTEESQTCNTGLCGTSCSNKKIYFGCSGRLTAEKYVGQGAGAEAACANWCGTQAASCCGYHTDGGCQARQGPILNLTGECTGCRAWTCR